MQVELTGTVKTVLPTQSGQSARGAWEKNFFVIEYMDNNYPNLLCLEVFGQDKWEKMRQNVVVGNRVQVKFGVSSHEYKGRYFTSCQCFYCANVGGNVQQQQTPMSQQQSNDSDGVPF